VGLRLSAAPPDWDARDGARGGVWEIHVAPSEPAIPNSLPASALEQLEQYTRQRQQYMLALPTPSPHPSLPLAAKAMPWATPRTTPCAPPPSDRDEVAFITPPPSGPFPAPPTGLG